MTQISKPIATVSLPILFKVPPFGAMTEVTIQGWAMAAARLGTILALPLGDVKNVPETYRPSLMPILDSADPDTIPSGVQMVEIPWSEKWQEGFGAIKKASPNKLVSVRISMSEGMEEKALSAAMAGVDLIHLEGGNYRTPKNGSEPARFDPFRVKEGIRAVHLKLVGANLRNSVGVLASGGFATAEHVPKALLCGADAVFSEFQLLIALQCRMCRRCVDGLSCPVDISTASSKWVDSRVVNLFGAWHNQILEVMGAMGIRDARRLRGEAGRAMFYEDLDEATFGFLGSLEEGCELE